MVSAAELRGRVMDASKRVDNLKNEKDGFGTPENAIKQIDQIVNSLGQAYEAAMSTPSNADDLVVERTIRETKREIDKLIDDLKGISHDLRDLLKDYFPARMAIAQALGSHPLTSIQIDIAEKDMLVKLNLLKAQMALKNEDVAAAVDTDIGTIQSNIKAKRDSLSEVKVAGLSSKDLTGAVQDVRSRTGDLGPDKITADDWLVRIQKVVDDITFAAKFNEKLSTKPEELAGIGPWMEIVKEKYAESFISSLDPDKQELAKQNRQKVYNVLSQMDVLVTQVLHEHAVTASGARTNPDLRRLLRPSIERTNDLEGPAQAFIGSFSSELRDAEGIALYVVQTDAADRPGRLSQAQRQELENLRERLITYSIRQNNAVIYDADGEVADDNQRELLKLVNYINEYVKWLEDVLDATDEAKKASTKALSSGGELSVDKIMAMDVASLNSQELVDAAKILWTILFADLKLPTDGSKADYNNKYNNIVKLLEDRPAEPGEDKDKWKDEAKYLKDRKELYSALAIGTSSAATVNYDSLEKGAPPGWLGAGTPAQFGEGEIMRLLYGKKLSAEYSDPEQSPNKKENLRIKRVDQMLTVCCTMLSEFNPRETNSDKRYGPFHATQNFTKDFQGKFREHVKEEWNEKFLKIPRDTKLDSDQEEALGLAMDMMAFLDLRTFFLLPFYHAGWSPKSGDAVGGTIGKTADRFTGLKDLYLSIGKTAEGFVISELMVRQLPKSVDDAKEPDAKKQNNLELAQLGTKIFTNFYSYDLDEGIEDDRAKVVYISDSNNYPNGANPVPLNCEILWVPKVLNDAGAVVPIKGISELARNKMLLAAGREREKDEKGKFSESNDSISYAGFLAGAVAVEKYVDSCQKGFPLEGDMKKAIDNVGKGITELFNAISPTKSIGTLDNRRLANYMLLYCRLSLQGFCEKYHKEPEFWPKFVSFLGQIRSSINGATTTSIPISDDLLPEQFRKRFGFVPKGTKDENDKDVVIKITDYVLQLLPQINQDPNFGSKIFATPGMTEEAARRVVESIQIDPIMHLNNEEELEEWKGERENIIKGTKRNVQRAFRAAPFNRGKTAHQLTHDGVKDFYHEVSHRPKDDRVKNVIYKNETEREQKVIAEFFRLLIIPHLQAAKKIVDKEEK